MAEETKGDMPNTPASKVALVRCESYEIDSVRSAVSRGMDLIGGAALFAKKDETILLKPNLLFGNKPEKCINTHHAVFTAVAEELLKTGARLTYGDHPGFGSVQAALRKTEIGPAAEKLGLSQADFGDGETVTLDNPLIQNEFTVARGVLDADGIISLPKLKTHGLERMTGCVKNQFGCVPGLAKPAFHIQYPDARDFGKMLVDLNRYLSPRLYVMDGIMGMEGNGPSGGEPVRMNVLLFSADPIALDATMCRIVGLDPEIIPTITFGHEAGLGTYRKNEIELLGDSIDHFYKFDFNVDRTQIRAFRDQGPFSFLSNVRVPKPRIVHDKCVRCGICIEACPADPKAITWTAAGKDEPPKHLYRNCIRCYCCQEMCPQSAIHLSKPLFRKR